MGGTMLMLMQSNERHATCPQPHEQLLVGWIVGGITHDRMGTNNDSGKVGTTGNDEGQWAQTMYKHRLGPTLVSFLFFFFFSNILLHFLN
jgi:hypothetical protein